MGEFIITNDDFTNRALFIKNTNIDDSSEIKEAELAIADNITIESTVTVQAVEKIDSIEQQETNNELTSANNEENISSDDDELRFVDKFGRDIPYEHINSKTLERLNAILEAKELSHPRSLAQYKLSQHPSTSPLSVMVDSLLEKTMQSSEAIVASRLAYIRQISDLIHEYDTIVNALLALAESFSVYLPSRKINQVTQEISEVLIPVTREGHFTAQEIALITIYLRKKMENFPATAQDLNTQIGRLTDEVKFKAAQIVSLKARLDDIIKQKPVMAEIFVLKRQGRDRYLYLNKKDIKSSKVITEQCIFTSKELAEKALLFAVKNQGSTTVKKVISYEIIQMIQGPVVTSTKLQEAMKNALK